MKGAKKPWEHHSSKPCARKSAKSVPRVTRTSGLCISRRSLTNPCAAVATRHRSGSCTSRKSSTDCCRHAGLLLATRTRINSGGYSYAQQGDDFVVINIMRNLGCERFTYLDLGAHHPWDISNTALFYENGCRGVNVEANPNLIRLFDKYRPEDTNVNVGVGTKAGKMPFYMIDEHSGRNSFLKANVEAFVRENPQFQITQVIDVPVMTPMGIIEEYCHGEWPDFVSIDVEGLDYDILAAADFSKSTPLVIDVETDRDDVAPITALMKERGYVPVFKCRGDMIFVRKEDRYQAVLGEVWQSCRPKKEG